MSSRFSSRSKNTMRLTTPSSMRNSQVDTDWKLPNDSIASVAALRNSPDNRQHSELHHDVISNIHAVQHHCQINGLCSKEIDDLHAEYIGGPIGFMKRKAGQMKESIVAHTKSVLGKIKVLQAKLKKSQVYWAGLVAKKKAMLARGASAYVSEKWLKAEEIEKKVTEDLIPKIKSTDKRISQLKIDIKKEKKEKKEKELEAAQAKHDAKWDQV